MMELSWDLQALLVVVLLAGMTLVMIPLFYGIQRSLAWYRVRQFSQCYLPHSHSEKPWRENRWT